MRQHDQLHEIEYSICDLIFKCHLLNIQYAPKGAGSSSTCYFNKKKWIYWQILYQSQNFDLIFSTYYLFIFLFRLINRFIHTRIHACMYASIHPTIFWKLEEELQETSEISALRTLIRSSSLAQVLLKQICIKGGPNTCVEM